MELYEEGSIYCAVCGGGQGVNALISTIASCK